VHNVHLLGADDVAHHGHGANDGGEANVVVEGYDGKVVDLQKKGG
jgi:hypothetical protein